MNTNKNKTIIKIVLFLLAFFILPAAFASAQENFDLNYIISDYEILDYSAMTLPEIQRLLENRGSFLANYSCADPDGKIMKASEIIYDRALTNRVNPRFLIILIQKEQGLIENPSPRQSQLDWAAGYGCPDGGGCNPRWQGFWKQINSASLQFRDYLDNPGLYTYKKNQTYFFTNPYASLAENRQPIAVTPQNQATAALYNYTPHVYNGNYNFWKIWQRYFSKSYPNGSLLQAAGDSTVYLVESGVKRAIADRAVLASRFDPKKIIRADKADIDKYPSGSPIKFPQYSIIRSPDKNLYLLVDDKKKLIASLDIFKKIGFNPEEVIDAAWEDINNYFDGPQITAASTYPTGALLQDKKSGGVYWVEEGKKSPIWDKIFLKTIFKNKKITTATTDELDKYLTDGPVKFADGELVKKPNSSGVYIIDNGAIRSFPNAETFVKLGYKWENIITVPEKIINLYPVGESMSLNNG